MKRYAKRLGAVVLLTALLAMLLSPVLYATGLWWGMPQVGGASYCTSYSIYPTTTTTGLPTPVPTPNQCNVTAPAGPLTFNGSEGVPVDLFAVASATLIPATNVAPSTAYVGLIQLGQGPYTVNGTSPANQPGTAIIANNTPYYIISGSQGSGFTITMPPNPVEGQIQRILCDTATVGTLTVAANTGQTLRNNPNAACVAGTSYAWRYIASSTTWYRT